MTADSPFEDVWPSWSLTRTVSGREPSGTGASGTVVVKSGPAAMPVLVTPSPITSTVSGKNWSAGIASLTSTAAPPSFRFTTVPSAGDATVNTGGAAARTRTATDRESISPPVSVVQDAVKRCLPGRGKTTMTSPPPPAADPTTVPSSSVSVVPV
jgi:hypothetical protein